MQKIFFLLFFIGLLIGIPNSVDAQSISSQNTAATNQTLSRFNPRIGISGSGNSFQGLNFSGVGGAILSCTNVGTSISNSLQGLFNKGGDGSQSGGVSVFGAGILKGTGSGGNAQAVPIKAAVLEDQAKKQTKTQNCLNGVAYAIAKNMLQQVTNRTLSFVNTGFGGNPLYVRDMDSFLKSIRDEKLSSFLQTVPNTNPIFGNALRSTITQQVTGYTDGRISKLMNTPEAQKYQAFQNDFTQGGWTSFLNPQNNAISAYFNAIDTVGTQISTQQQATKEELAQGNGFLSVKKCVEWSDGNDTPVDERLPDSVDPTAAPVTCVRYETATPGKIIADQTAAVTTSSVRQLEQADQINEVLGSFFDQLLTRLFTDGLGSLTRNSGTPRCSGGSGIGCNVVYGTDGQPLATSASSLQALGYESVTGGFNGDFDISRPQQLRAIIKTQMDYINRASDANKALQRVVPVLGALDYCIPGPNPTWADNLKENYDIHVSSLVQPAADDPSLLLNIVQSIPLIGGFFSDPEPPSILASKGYSLFDKVTNQFIETTDRPAYYGDSLINNTIPLGANINNTVLITKNNVIEVMLDYIDRGYKKLVTDYTQVYSANAIITAFKQVTSQDAASQRIAENQIKEALIETSKLPSYNLATQEYSTQYADDIHQTEYAVQELTDIYQEVTTIVGNAKARYIREQEAAGTPVNLSCINQAYIINTTPITAEPRQESDGIDPFSVRSMEAAQYFYANL